MASERHAARPADAALSLRPLRSRQPPPRGVAGKKRAQRPHHSPLARALTPTPHSSQARPFDFLLDGQLLRGSLAKAIVERGLSGEVTITLEYIELLAPPEPRNQSLHPDWVSSVSVRAATDAASSAPLLSGCYDGCLYLYDRNGVQQAVLGAGEDPTKD